MQKSIRKYQFITEENISQEFRLSNIDQTINFFFEEINQGELMSKKHKRFCGVLNYIEHLLILVSIVTRWVSASAFASLVAIPAGIGSSVVGLKVCAITARIEK